jgi:hypothetical protein
MFHVPIHSVFFLLLGTDKHYLTAEHQAVSYVAKYQAKHIHLCQFEILITLCLFLFHVFSWSQLALHIWYSVIQLWTIGN